MDVGNTHLNRALRRISHDAALSLRNRDDGGYVEAALLPPDGRSTRDGSVNGSDEGSRRDAADEDEAVPDSTLYLRDGGTDDGPGLFNLVTPAGWASRYVVMLGRGVGVVWVRVCWCGVETRMHLHLTLHWHACRTHAPHMLVFHAAGGYFRSRNSTD